MPIQSDVTMLDYLPAVFRDDEIAAATLQQFLAAFERIFTGIQAEIDAIPALFAATPAPSLAAAAAAGDAAIVLESTAGLCPGDTLQVVDAAKVEFIHLQEIDCQTTVTLAAPLRFSHGFATRLRLLEAARLAASLGGDASPGDEALTLAGTETTIAQGDILRVGVGEDAELLAVAGPPEIDLDAVRITLPIAPPPRRSHRSGAPLVSYVPRSTTTPPLAFRTAARGGPEVLLTADARAGHAFVALDDVSGLMPGDVLHLRARDPSRAELALVRGLPEAPSETETRLRVVSLVDPLREDHEYGLEVAVMTPVAATALGVTASQTATTLELSDAALLGAVPGDALLVGDDATGEPVQVEAVSGNTIEVAPPLRRDHVEGEPARRVAPVGSGTAFLAWLAGWIGLPLRTDRGERWNRELLRRAVPIWPSRGTARGLETFLDAALRGEAHTTVVDPANPLQIGLVSRIGEDTFICGGRPFSFWIDILADPRNARLYHPDGLADLTRTARELALRERPAHTTVDLRLLANTMRIGAEPARDVGIRIGETSLLWDAPRHVPGDE